MDIEWLRKLCLSLPGTSEDIKWGNDLCFLVAGKMFCVAGLDRPQKIAFKVPDDEFEELSTSEGFIPAPYMARAKWVLVEDISRLTKKEWKEYVLQSYELVKQKLPKKLIKEFGLEK
jgi:predicted DNA-binding protein (MmcQ/YjbR family)